MAWTLGLALEVKNRGTGDVCIAVCDGLVGLGEAITDLIRNPFRYASRRDREVMAKDLRPVYTATAEAAVTARYEEFAARWVSQYPAIGTLWRRAWAEFVPFLDYDVETRSTTRSRA